MERKRIFKGKTIQNAGWLIGGKLAQKTLSFLVGILTARYLGPDNYGLVNYAGAYVTFFASLCTLGLPNVLVQELVRHPDEEGMALGTALALRSLSSLLSAVMIVGVVLVVDAGAAETLWVVALSSLGLVFQTADTLQYWFQAKLQSKYWAIATVLSFGVSSAYKLALLMLGKGAAWFALATSVDYLAAGMIALLAYRKNNGPKWSVSRKKAEKLLKSGGSFILSGLMVSIYSATDKLMLKRLLDEAAVGQYALASSLSLTWAFVLQAVIDSAAPAIFRAHGQDRDTFERRNRQLYALVFYLAVGMSLVICLLAEPLVRILYGEAYLPAVVPLRIVVWYAAFAYLGVARNAWIVCENRQKGLTPLYMAAAGINVVLNGMLIPRWGASGAALASLVTQMATTVVLPALNPSLRPNAKLLWEAIRFKGLFQKEEHL